MNPGAVNIAVIDGKMITEAVDINAAQAGKLVRIKAIQGGQYLLAEGERGLAPQNVMVVRVGNNLHLSLEGAQEPQLIIEGFYESGGQLVGVAADGEYYVYTPSDAEQPHDVAFLMDNEPTALVLDSKALPGFADGLVVATNAGWLQPTLLGLGALGLAGAAYALAKNLVDDSDHDSPDMPPRQPMPTVANDDVGALTGPIVKGGVTDDKQPTFSGAGGQPGSKMEIWDNGSKIGEAVVGADGRWSFTPGKPLAEGAHSIVLIEQGPGGASPPSEGFDFIVDTVAPGKSKVSEVQDDIGADTGTLANGGRTDDARPTLNGTGEPGARIDIYDNGQKIGQTTVNADGTWCYTPDADLVDGSHSLTTVAIDAAGNAGLPSDPFTLVIDTSEPDLTPPGQRQN